MGGLTSQFVISALAVVTGGGVIQGIVFILRRRSDLANVDANTEKVRVEADRVRSEIAADLASQLADEATRQASRNLALEKRIDELQAQAATDRSRYETRIAAEIAGATTLILEVAALRNELGVARRQITILENRLNAAHGGTN